MSSRKSKSGGSPNRSTNRNSPPPKKSSRANSDQGSETEASVISEGIPPKSIKHMRENLRNIIDMMGDENCGCTNDNSDSVATAGSGYCDSPVTEPSCRECRCCGKQTSSSESGECCSCNNNVIQPEVHKVCTGKNVRAVGECIDTQQVCLEDTVVAKCTNLDKYQCIDRSPCYAQNERAYCTASGGRQVRGYGKCVDEKHFLGPDSASSSEECPCEEPCPGKQNAKKKIKNFLNKVVGIKENMQVQHELYKFRLKQQDPNFKLPRRLVFDLVDGIPKVPPVDKEKPKKLIIKSDMEDYNNKVDIYYFDHGNSGYYRTTDHPPPLMADFFIEQTDLYATRFWAEIFGTIHIGVAFVTTFLLQFFRFIFYSVLRPLTIGLIQLASDYFFKPLLSITFNGIIQPLLILMYNIATSFRDLCEPIAQGVGYFLREIANVFRSVRLVEVNKIKTMNPSCNV